ncbi:MAG: DNA-directed RNA polymerase subunit beta [Parcubacteria group bacterium GW2011_GWB1_43_6]|nr:MAG: DNA-directed RNA polymerase subunit beta [Parcubacteria group bacterium GW2011_GWB1_43_6]
MPNLVVSQNESFKWLVEKGLNEVFTEFASISDYSGKKFELSFKSVKLEEAKHDEYYTKNNKLSYEAPLKAIVELKNKIRGGGKEQEIFLADFPMMTSHGTFIISGVERVIVPQLARSFGIFFTSEELKGKKCFGGKIIPARGVWIEIETEADGVIYVRIDRKRKFVVTSLLRVLGAETLKHRLSKTMPRPLTTRLLKFIKECVMAKLARWKMPKNLSKEFSAKIVTICPKLADSNLINDLENQWKAKRATAERFHWMML